jgi:hypothetical protein
MGRFHIGMMLGSYTKCYYVGAKIIIKMSVKKAVQNGLLHESGHLKFWRLN